MKAKGPPKSSMWQAGCANGRCMYAVQSSPMRTAVDKQTLKTNADASRNFRVRIPTTLLGPETSAKHKPPETAQSGKNASIQIQSLAMFAIIAAYLSR